MHNSMKKRKIERGAGWGRRGEKVTEEVVKVEYIRRRLINDAQLSRDSYILV